MTKPIEPNEHEEKDKSTEHGWHSRSMSVVGIDFRMSTEIRKPPNPLRAAVKLWALAMDSMLRESQNASLKPRNIECTAPRQTKWIGGQQLLRFS